MSQPTQSPNLAPLLPIGIIGGGFGALMAYTVLRFRGVPAESIRIFSTDLTPERSWEGFIRKFRLTHMRSESLGHFFPTDSPGLASVEAVKSWSLKPFFLSWFDAYHPTVDFFLEHTRTIARLVGYGRSVVHCTVKTIQREAGHFHVIDDNDQMIAEVQHVIIAVGHGHLNIPEPLARYRAHYGQDQLVVHSFEDKEYLPPRTVIVVGDGLTAGNEWANILQEGGTVIAITRSGSYSTQALNTPRKYFSRRGITPFRGQSEGGRLQELKTATRGTLKPYRMWMKLFKRAEVEGRLKFIAGELVSIDRLDPAHVQAMVRLHDGHSVTAVTADQLIIATGFLPPTTHPFWAKLITQYRLPMVGHMLKVEEDFCIKALSTPTSGAFVIGQVAGWVLPSADSLGGMKIAAHQIADYLVGPETWRLTDLWSKTTRWAHLVGGKELV